MAGFWPRSLFGLVNKYAKELGQYTTILTSRLVNNAY